LPKQTIIKIITSILGVLLFILALAYANTDISSGNHSSSMDFETARVLEILEDDTEINENFPETRIGQRLILVEILTGEHAGRTGEIRNYFTPSFQVDVRQGSRISVIVGQVDAERFDVLLHNRERTSILFGSVIFFFLALGIIGGKKGMLSIIGLAFTLISILFLLVPLLIKGYAAIPVTILILAITTVISLILLSGWTQKTIIAIIGCISGVIVAGLLAFFVSTIAGVNGFNMEEADQLLAVGLETNLRIGGLFISGVLIASLGAVMDIAMTIASSAEELTASNKHITSGQLFKSSMNIGRDAMGTMSNTLILAFVGTGLNMMIVIFSFDISFQQLINMDFIAIEIIRSLAGSLGLVITVPIVAYLASKWIPSN
jgi:uncharacterized membrane protein